MMFTRVCLVQTWSECQTHTVRAVLVLRVVEVTLFISTAECLKLSPQSSPQEAMVVRKIHQRVVIHLIARHPVSHGNTLQEKANTFPFASLLSGWLVICFKHAWDVVMVLFRLHQRCHQVLMWRVHGSWWLPMWTCFGMLWHVHMGLLILGFLIELILFCLLFVIARKCAHVVINKDKGALWSSHTWNNVIGQQVDRGASQ